jgi:hypothetical protein
VDWIQKLLKFIPWLAADRGVACSKRISRFSSAGGGSIGMGFSITAVLRFLQGKAHGEMYKRVAEIVGKRICSRSVLRGRAAVSLAFAHTVYRESR